MQHNISISKQLIKNLIHNEAFSNLDDLSYPECSGIEDEQYTCTTCWNNKLSIQSIIENLYNQTIKQIITFRKH